MSGSNNNCEATGKLDNIVGLSINQTGAKQNATVTTTERVGPCRTAIVVQGGAILDLGVCDGNNAPGDNTTRSFPSASTNMTGNHGDLGRCAANFRMNFTGTPDTLTVQTYPLNSSPAINAFQVGVKTLNSEFDENGPRDRGGDEIVYVRFENRSNYETGLSVDQSQSRFAITLNELKENDDIKRAMTNYGTLVELFDPSGTDRAEDLTFEYPLVQRGVHVFVVSGEYGIKASAAGGSSQRVNRINVGAAKLASEVEDITAVNAIVVGGPCVNAAAAALMATQTTAQRASSQEKA